MPNGFSFARSRVPVVLFIALDMLVSYGASTASSWARFGYVESSFEYQALGLIHVLLVATSALAVGAYQPSRGRALLAFLSRVFIAWFLSFTCLVAFLVMTKTTEDYSRIWMGTWITSAITVTLVLRACIYQWLLSDSRPLS